MIYEYSMQDCKFESTECRNFIVFRVNTFENNLHARTLREKKLPQIVVFITEQNKMTYIIDLRGAQGSLTKSRLNKVVYPVFRSILSGAVIFIVVITTITCQTLHFGDVWPSTLDSTRHFI